MARYLALLGVKKRSVSCEGLKELVAAQLTCLPFENISKLFYKKRFGLTGIPSIEMYLDGAEKLHFGGTCYSNNFHLYSLLVSLGYDARLCSADMARPNVHMVIMVRVDGREYLVDTGYAAPFIAPLPRDWTTDYVIALGRDRYVLKPQDEDGCSRVELYRNGVYKHGYRARPSAREIGDFRDVIAESFRPEATFLNSILVARFYPKSSVVIHNRTLIESRADCSEIRTIAELDMVPAVLHEHVGMPEDVVAEAIDGLKLTQDAWDTIPVGCD